MGKQRESNRRSIASNTGRALLLLCLSLVAGPTMVQAWSEPLSPPGSYNLEPVALRDTFKFLNASTAPQQKKGSLVIGLSGGTAKLCLNSNPAHPANDPDACISAWDDLRGQPFLHLGKNDAGGNLGFYSDFTSGPLISIKNNLGAGQLFSLITEANPAVTGATALTTYSNVPGGGYTDFNYAAYFSGSVLVGTAAWNSAYSLCLSDTATAGLLLPGNTSKGCITKWSDLFFAPGGISAVHRLSTGTPVSPESGQASVTHSWGSGSTVVGSTAGLPIAYTCGDLMCSNNTSPAETSVSCPADCAGILSIARFIAWPSNGKVFFDARTWPNPGVQQRVIVLRKEGSAPAAVPQDGVTYSVGQRVGDSIVAYAPATLYGPNQDFLDSDNGLVNGRTYYYVAFPSSAVPRYGSGTTVTSATPNLPTASLRLTFAHSNATIIDVTEETYNATPTVFTQCQADCTVPFTPGARVRLTTDVLTAGYSWNGYDGECTTSALECTFTMPAGGASVHIKMTRLGGGGGGGGGGGEGREPLHEL